MKKILICIFLSLILSISASYAIEPLIIDYIEDIESCNPLKSEIHLSLEYEEDMRGLYYYIIGKASPRITKPEIDQGDFWPNTLPLIIEINTDEDVPEQTIILRHNGSTPQYVFLPEVLNARDDTTVTMFIANDGATYYACKQGGRKCPNTGLTSKQALKDKYLARKADSNVKCNPKASDYEQNVDSTIYLAPKERMGLGDGYALKFIKGYGERTIGRSGEQTAEFIAYNGGVELGTFPIKDDEIGKIDDFPFAILNIYLEERGDIQATVIRIISPKNISRLNSKNGFYCGDTLHFLDPDIDSQNNIIRLEFRAMEFNGQYIITEKDWHKENQTFRCDNSTVKVGKFNKKNGYVGIKFETKEKNKEPEIKIIKNETINITSTDEISENNLTDPKEPIETPKIKKSVWGNFISWFKNIFK
jgi:hypothetical protein